MKLRHPNLDAKVNIEPKDEDAQPYLDQGWVEVQSRKPAAQSE